MRRGSSEHGGPGVGDIAIVKLFILKLMQLLAGLPFVALYRSKVHREVDLICAWYSEHHPHTGVGGVMPHEKYFNLRQANRLPRWEPRERWPRGSPCALVKVQPGAQVELALTFHAARQSSR